MHALCVRGGPAIGRTTAAMRDCSRASGVVGGDAVEGGEERCVKDSIAAQSGRR